jgi:hypothetical protein
MNNEQFRKLISANSAKSDGAKNGKQPATATPSGSALGSRQRASIPMTPYVWVPSVNFRRLIVPTGDL